MYGQLPWRGPVFTLAPPCDHFCGHQLSPCNTIRFLQTLCRLWIPMKTATLPPPSKKLFRLPAEHQEFLLKCLILALIYVLGMWWCYDWWWCWCWWFYSLFHKIVLCIALWKRDSWGMFIFLITVFWWCANNIYFPSFFLLLIDYSSIRKYFFYLFLLLLFCNQIPTPH